MKSVLRLLAALALAGVAAWVQAQEITPQLMAERDAKARDYFSDTVLTTHTGRKVRFYTDVMKGKVILINFIYTGCGDACPLITAKLKQAKQELAQVFGKEVRFISISIDPLNDTPEKLTAFTKKMEVNDPEWFFLTGDMKSIDYVVGKLGAYSEGVEDHFVGMIMGSTQQSRFKKVRPDAPPQAIVLELNGLAEDEKKLQNALAGKKERVSQQ